MKRVEVTIAPAKLDEVKDALSEAGVPGMTVHEARVFGRATRRHEVYLGSSYVVDFVLKVKVEMVVLDEAVATILEVLKESDCGMMDGSNVLISDVVYVMRIRTSERGEEAIDDRGGVRAGSASPWSPATSPDRASYRR